MERAVAVLAISYGRQLFDPDNAERQRLEYCSREVAAHHIIIFTHQSDECREQSAGNLYLHPTNSKSKLHMLFDALRIGRRLLQPKRHWVITAQDPFETSLIGLRLARRFRVPLNIQEHGDFFSTPYWRQDRPLNFLRYWFGKFALRRADSVRVVSARIRRTLIDLGVPAERIISLPVRSDSVTELSAAASTTNAKRIDAPLTIVGMGRFVAQKNFPLLINAFASLLAKHPTAQLVLVGQGELLPVLQAQIAKRNLTENVQFVPWSADPLSLIARADIFALSSDWEGWARVLVEAMSVGVPIVTTDVGCAGEVVADGVHGFVVPVRDQAQFAEKLQRLANDPELRAQFSQNALRDVTATHVTLEAYATQWADVFTRTHLNLNHHSN